MKKNKYYIFIILLATPYLSFSQVSIDLKNPLNSLARYYDNTIIKESHIMKAYYCEYAKYNEQYVSFTDAVGVFMSFGDVCNIPSNCMVFYPINMRKSDRDSTYLKLLEAVHEKKENKSFGLRSDYQPEIVAVLNAYKWFEIDGPLNRKKTKLFDSSVKKVNNEILEIQFKTKKKFEHSVHDYEGSIFYNIEKNTIDSVKVIKGKKFCYQYHTFVYGYMNISYDSDGGRLWPNTITVGYKDKQIETFSKVSILNEKPTLIYLSENDFGYFAANQVYSFVYYNEKNWKQYNLNQCHSFNEFKKSTIGASSLEKQFVNNSNQPFSVGKSPENKIFPPNDWEVFEYIRKRTPELLELLP